MVSTDNQRANPLSNELTKINGFHYPRLFDRAAVSSPAAKFTVALVGNPNTGKSTFFSALCGVPARIGNYPGVTVEKKIGKYRDSQGTVTVVDLPGTYSLSARTPDEMVSVDVLLGRQADVAHVDVIVAIVDATNLERNLYLFTQLRQLNRPIVLVLNMWDRMQAEGRTIEVDELSRRLGVRSSCLGQP
ncbi:MAG: FeoB small GTPase domain-containing protein [Pirellulaceae bacterium]